MTKMISLLLALVITLSLCACGDTNPSPTGNPTAQATTEPTIPETYYNIGDTVSTNLFNFTLDAATLAIALENTHGDTLGDPKEYNPQEDSKNPYVAPTGHTYVAFTYTVENISRSSESFHGGDFVKVIYKDTEYTTTLDDVAVLYYQENQYYSNGSMHTQAANVWYSCDVGNMLVGAAEKQSRKASADFAIEADSLTDAFYLRISIPSTNGKETFTYQIPSSN